MKRFAAAVIALSLLPAASAAGHGRDIDVSEHRDHVKVDGPGFKVKLSKHGLRVKIDDRRFGIPEAGFPIERIQQNVPATVRPFVCDNGTYRVVSAVFDQTERASATALRPLPYPPAFGAAFPDIFTFVGTIDGLVQNENGEQFRLLMSDLAHEELTSRSFTSTNPVHAYFVDARGKIRDRASLVGRVRVDRATGAAVHNIVDKGTCHQTATLLGQPGVTVFGPFFVLPFPTTVIRR